MEKEEGGDMYDVERERKEFMRIVTYSREPRLFRRLFCCYDSTHWRSAWDGGGGSSFLFPPSKEKLDLLLPSFDSSWTGT